jgi:hypothetical protein
LQGGTQPPAAGADDQGIKLAALNIHRLIRLPASGFAAPTDHSR